jgi:hypothetical protein
VVTAWTEGGSVSDATIRLVATPSSQSAEFNFGCGSSDGTRSCDLGEVTATSAQRQLEAQVTVPTTATSVTSVQLTAIGSASDLSKDPQVFAAIAVKAAPAKKSGSGAGTDTPTPSSTASALPVGDLPYLNGQNGSTSSSTVSPGGNASGLFPPVNPSPQAGSSDKPGQRANARTVASTSALPLGAPVVGAQLVGLGVLALAFVLAITRLSIRRRPAAAAAGGSQAGSGGSAASGGSAGSADNGQPAYAGKHEVENKPANGSKPADDADGKARASGPTDNDKASGNESNPGQPADEHKPDGE